MIFRRLKIMELLMTYVKRLAFVFTILAFQPVLAQDSLNFRVIPVNTSCDSIVMADVDFETALSRISGATFRFQQNISVSRRKGFREAAFFSCDNERGFMLITYDDLSMLYENMPKSLWDELVKSGNPGVYYEEKVREHFKASLVRHKES